MPVPYGKKATPPLEGENSKRFQKDWDRLLKSGRYDMGRFKETMLLILANDGPLPAEYNDHQLTGKLAEFRECHVGGNFLLMYQVVMVDKLWGAVFFARAGTHSELFQRLGATKATRPLLARLPRVRDGYVIERMANMIYNEDYWLSEFGHSDVEELVGWRNGEELPVINGRTTKILRFFGAKVRQIA